MTRSFVALAMLFAFMQSAGALESMDIAGNWSSAFTAAGCPGKVATSSGSTVYANGAYTATVSGQALNASCQIVPWGPCTDIAWPAGNPITRPEFLAWMNSSICLGGLQWSSVAFDPPTVTLTGSAATLVWTLTSPSTFLLGVATGGTGNGTVTSNSGGINCGATCSASFAAGTAATLSATPAAGSVFSGWSGACSGTGSCIVTMDAAKSVAATFRPQPFVATTTTSITSTTATISSQIAFNAADVGKTGAVFVTARVPSGSLVAAQANADTVSRARILAAPTTTTSTSTFVLVQLTPSGWQPVVNGQLTPYASGVLGEQLATQSILNGANAALLKGAQFCVGYGTSAAEMTAAGRMLLVATISDSTSTTSATGTCLVTVQTGWWWNPAESGRGFFLETSGGTAFLASYLYAGGGRATWYASTMQQSAGSFAGTLDAFSNGQSLTGTYRAPSAAIGSGGNATIALTDATHGTLNWAGGATPIERLTFADNSNPPAFQPEPGWWWYPSEAGRGFSIEVQGSSMFLAGYMYDTAGNPLWYLSIGTLSGQGYSGNWSQYANGQALGGAYAAPTQVNAAVGTLTIQFASAIAGILTLPDGRQIPVERYRF